jgi:protein-S-isoprenylcysteine O-methyltransferase Ste14
MRLYAVVPVVASLAGALLASVDPFTVRTGAFGLVGGLGCAAGVGLVVWTTLTYARVGGTLSPVADPERLVVDGPLARVRNPMYLGILACVAGIAVLAGSPVTAGYAALLAGCYHLLVVLVEEPRLHRAFGERYGWYRERVPRWRPRLRPAAPRPPPRPGS